MAMDEMLAGATSGLLGFLTWIMMIAFILACLAGIFFVVRYKMRYKIPVHIYYYDPLGNLRLKKDKAAIIYNKKSDMKLFFLQKHKAGLNPDNPPIIRFENSKEKFVPLFQMGLKDFRYVRKWSVTNPEATMALGEEDLNWFTHEFNVYSNIFKTRDLIMQYLPFALVALSCITILIIFIWFFKQFDVLKELGTQLHAAAAEVAKAKAGTVVVGG